MKKIIITGDDYGYCEQRNLGIIECFKSGIVQRATLMVNGDAIEQGIELARKHKMLVGLHLNLTEGSPISSNIPSLVEKTGFMLGKQGFRDALAQGKVSRQDIKEEIRAQIQKFQEATGKLPPFVDGHQHVHVLPGVKEVFVEVLRINHIFETRLMIEIGIEEMDWMEPGKIDFFRNVVKDSINAKELFMHNGLRFTDGFVGLCTMGSNMTIERLQECIVATFQDLGTQKSKKDASTTEEKKIQSDILTCELMVHPGYPSLPGIGGVGQGPDRFSCSKDREHELTLLQNEKFKAFLIRENIALIESVLQIEPRS